MARAKQLLQEIETYAQNIGDTIRDPLLILDRELRVKSANRSFYKTFQATPEETENQLIYTLGNGQWNIPDLLDLLRDIVPTKSHFDDFEVSHDFPKIGHKVMLLNARKLYRPGNRTVLIALAMEDVTLRRKTESELASMHERDRRIAVALQRSLLYTPPDNVFPGMDVKAVYETGSDEALVGGDFWDAFSFGTGKLALVIGDVMGKGLKAAVFTAELKYAVRGFVREHEKPDRVMGQMNSYICETNRLFREGLNHEGDDAPVCLSVAVVDTQSGAGLVCTAGMERGLCARNDGQVEEFGISCTCLGVDPHAEYAQSSFQLETADSLVMTTDGITEARQGPEFLGLEGLKMLALRGRQVGNLEQMGRFILDGARKYGGGTLRDDAAILLCRRR